MFMNYPGYRSLSDVACRLNQLYTNQMTPERKARIEAVARRRQADLTVFLEQVHKPHNFAAIIRTCDAVGVSQAHAVPAREGLPTLNHTSQGAQRWVTVHRHRDAADGLKELKAAGFTLYAAHFSDQAVDFREPDYTRPSAIVLGTEKFGISETALALCDIEIHIPMMGMAQSLNVSVACALILYEAQRQRQAAGLYEPIDPDQEPARSLIGAWSAREAARKKTPTEPDQG